MPSRMNPGIERWRESGRRDAIARYSVSGSIGFRCTQGRAGTFNSYSLNIQYVPMGRSQTRPDAAAVPADVLEFVRAGKKPDAIRRYHEPAGVDLAHARQVIDDL